MDDSARGPYTWQMRITRVLLMGWMLLCLMPLNGRAEADGEASPGRLKKMWSVFSRGVVNVVAMPLEIPRTIVEEQKEHPGGWWIRCIPQSFENVTARTVSAVHDSLIYPVYASFRKEVPPLTRKMNLPDYPWQYDVHARNRDYAADTVEGNTVLLGGRA